MSQRIPLVVGNWKMNTTVEEGVELALAVRNDCQVDAVEVVLLPPFTHLWPLTDALRSSAIGLGAQDVFWAESGAYTGEVSAAMLADICSYVLIGHSERRHLLGEDDATVARKLATAVGHDLRVILAVGETEAEHNAGQTEEVINRQLDSALDGVDGAALARIEIAYEPVWAIGTGRTASPQQAQDVCALIRARLDATVRDSTRVLYGGSANPANAAELFAQPDIDGGLIGGASLKAQDFAAVVAAAKPVADRV